MKLIIDIPEDMFEWFKNGEIVDEYDKSALKQVFKNGTPLDDVTAEIADLPTNMFEAYKLKSRVLYMLDNIGKAESEET